MIVVVPATPPRAGLVLPSLVESTPITPSEAAVLAEAALIDVCRTVVKSGADLLVNYRDEETLPAGAVDGEQDPETEIRTIVERALESTDGVRFERQVGSTHAARIGNTVTHLLEREGAGAVTVCEPTSPLVARTDIDGAAMALRRHDVVLGPTDGGGVYLSGFTEPIDFTDAYDPPALSRLAGRVADRDGRLGFAPMLPTMTTEAGLCGTIAALEARAVARRPGAEATAQAVETLELAVGVDGIVREA